MKQGEAFEKCAAAMQLQSPAGLRPLTALQTDKYRIKQRNSVAAINRSHQELEGATTNKCQLLPIKNHIWDDRITK